MINWKCSLYMYIVILILIFRYLSKTQCTFIYSKLYQCSASMLIQAVVAQMILVWELETGTEGQIPQKLFAYQFFIASVSKPADLSFQQTRSNLSILYLPDEGKLNIYLPSQPTPERTVRVFSFLNVHCCFVLVSCFIGGNYLQTGSGIWQYIVKIKWTN